MILRMFISIVMFFSTMSNAHGAVVIGGIDKEQLINGVMIDTINSVTESQKIDHPEMETPVVKAQVKVTGEEITDEPRVVVMIDVIVWRQDEHGVVYIADQFTIKKKLDLFEAKMYSSMSSQP